jgi:hypothetical protein
MTHRPFTATAVTALVLLSGCASSGDAALIARIHTAAAESRSPAYMMSEFEPLPDHNADRPTDSRKIRGIWDIVLDNDEDASKTREMIAAERIFLWSLKAGAPPGEFRLAGIYWKTSTSRPVPFVATVYFP